MLHVQFSTCGGVRLRRSHASVRQRGWDSWRCYKNARAHSSLGATSGVLFICLARRMSKLAVIYATKWFLVLHIGAVPVRLSATRNACCALCREPAQVHSTDKSRYLAYMQAYLAYIYEYMLAVKSLARGISLPNLQYMTRVGVNNSVGKCG